MVCDVIVHDGLSQETDLIHEVHVLDPMSIREFIPLAAYLLALLRETLGGRELVARRGVELRGCRQSIAFCGNNPRVPAFGEHRLRGRERDETDVVRPQPAVSERDFNRLSREAEVMLDARDALFLQGKQNAFRRADRN